MNFEKRDFLKDLGLILVKSWLAGVVAWFVCYWVIFRVLTLSPKVQSVMEYIFITHAWTIMGSITVGLFAFFALARYAEYLRRR